MKVKTQSKKVNKSWLNDHVNDPYVKLAKKEGYRARAAYKLKEIDESYIAGENTLEENVGHLFMGVHDEKVVRKLKDAVYKDSTFNTLYYYGR